MSLENPFQRRVRPLKAHAINLGLNKVRKTWKHTLSPEKNAARIEQMRFCKKVRKALGDEFEVTFYFNPGGPAVWGETYVKIFRYAGLIPCKHCGKSIYRGVYEWQHETPIIEHIAQPLEASKVPVVEACLSKEFSYIRQWDGNHSGYNNPISYASQAGLGVHIFVQAVKNLAAQPFRRF